MTSWLDTNLENMSRQGIPADRSRRGRRFKRSAGRYGKRITTRGPGSLHPVGAHAGAFTIRTSCASTVLEPTARATWGWIRGWRSLHQHLKRVPCGRDRLKKSCCDTRWLEAIHSPGFASDIKPSNVFLRENGAPLLSTSVRRGCRPAIFRKICARSCLPLCAARAIHARRSQGRGPIFIRCPACFTARSPADTRGSCETADERSVPRPGRARSRTTSAFCARSNGDSSSMKSTAAQHRDGASCQRRAPMSALNRGGVE